VAVSDRVKRILDKQTDGSGDTRPIETGLEHRPRAYHARAMEIAALKLMQRTNREIARELDLDESTVSKYVNGEAFQLVIQQVRERMIETRGDITKRLEGEQERNLDILLKMRDNEALEPNERRLIIKDLNEWLRNPPTGRDRIKETVTLKLAQPPEPDEVSTRHDDTAPAVVVPLSGLERN